MKTHMSNKASKNLGIIIVSHRDLKSTYKSKKYFDLALKNYGNLLPLIPSKELAVIAGSLLTDGHIDIRKRDLSMYYGYIGFFSKYKHELEKFENNFFKVFKVKGKIRNWGIKRYGKCKGYIVINSVISRILYLSGIPGGDKVSQTYDVPSWVKNSDMKIQQAFLKTIFDCEGTITYSKQKHKWEIKYSMYKTLDLLNNSIQFLNNLGKMLGNFDIKTKIHKKEQYVRKKDNKKIIGLNLKFDDYNSINGYAKYIGFDINYKKERLSIATNKFQIKKKIDGPERI